MKNTSTQGVTASCLGFTLAVAFATPVSAFNFGDGNEGVKGAIDTDLTYGLQFRDEDADSRNGAYGNRVLYSDKGDIFNNQVRASMTISLEQGSNYGALIRGNYFYDFESHDAKLRGEAKDQLESKGTLTDAYVYGYFGAEQQLMVRLGKQVISWGENTFIQYSLSEINTVNLDNLRQPGRELKNAFLGTEAIYATYNFLENWTLEAFQLFKFDSIELDPMGSFWATLDGVGIGGGKDKDGNGILLEGGTGNCVTLDGRPCDLLGGGLTRISDKQPSEGGQYGFALRRFFPNLFNGTELAVYFENLHDRNPVVSVHRGTGHYFLDYPEDQHRYGVSYNTNIAGWAMGGEYSFRKDATVQLLSPLLAGLGSAATGAYLPGYAEVDRHQVQMTFQRIWGVNYTIGADSNMTLVEVAYGWIDDLPQTDLFEPAITQNFSTVQILQRFGYNAALFNLFEVNPYFAYKWDIDGTSQELGAGKGFVENRQALTLGVGLAYQGGAYTADFSWTGFSGRTNDRNRAGGLLNGREDRDYWAISFGMSF